MVRIAWMFVALVACGTSEDKKAATSEQGARPATAAAPAVPAAKGPLTVAEQVADAEAPAALKAIAPPVVAGKMIARRVTPTSIEVDLCGDGKAGPVIKQLGESVRSRYPAEGVHGSYQVTLSWPGGTFAVREGSGYDHCEDKSQHLLTVSMAIQ